MNGSPSLWWCSWWTHENKPLFPVWRSSEADQHWEMILPRGGAVLCSYTNRWSGPALILASPHKSRFWCDTSRTSTLPSGGRTASINKKQLTAWDRKPLKSKNIIKNVNISLQPPQRVNTLLSTLSISNRFKLHVHVVPLHQSALWRSGFPVAQNQSGQIISVWYSKCFCKQFIWRYSSFICVLSVWQSAYW